MKYFKEKATAIIKYNNIDKIINKQILQYGTNEFILSEIDFNCLCYNLYKYFNNIFKLPINTLKENNYNLTIKINNEIVYEEYILNDKIYTKTCIDEYIKNTLIREVFRNTQERNLDSLTL